MFDSYKKIQCDMGKIEDIDFIEDSPFILSINWDNVLFEFLIRYTKKSNKSIVFASGAYDSNKFTPPVFQRHSWSEHFDQTVIYFNDPTLYLGKINLGWGFGTIKSHYLKDISLILKVVFKKMDIENKNVVFYGSSAGGYMSMVLAGFLQESRALVNNPQTIVSNYYVRHVNNLFDAAMPEINKEEILKQYNDRLNIMDFFKKINYVPEIYYLQNISCSHDMNNHFNPFVYGLKDVTETFYFNRVIFDLYFDKEKDHNPLDLEETIQYINKYSQKNL